MSTAKMAAERPTDDRALVDSYRAGDASAFSRLHEKHGAFVTNYARRIVHDWQATEDVAQDTWLKAHINIGRYDGSSAFSTWLCTIARNTAFDYLKSRKRKRAYTFTELSDDDSERLSDYRAQSRETDPAEAAEMMGSVEEAMRAVQDLPENQRRVVEERYLKDLSCVEISRALDISMGTVRTMLYRARETLRQQLVGKAV